ncbi:MAG TPA: hypothetical protein VF077_06215 [Nitrospiraceae bacterium]
MRVRTIGTTDEVVAAWLEMEPMPGVSRNGGRGEKQGYHRGTMSPRCNVYRDVTKDGLHRLFSYGDHFCLGVIVPGESSSDNKPIVLLLDRYKNDWSRTTQKHVGEVESAAAFKRIDGGVYNGRVIRIGSMDSYDVADLDSVRATVNRAMDTLRGKYGIPASYSNMLARRVYGGPWVKFCNRLRDQVLNHNTIVELGFWQNRYMDTPKPLAVPPHYREQWEYVRFEGDERVAREVADQIRGTTKRCVFGKWRERDYYGEQKRQKPVETAAASSGNWLRELWEVLSGTGLFDWDRHYAGMGVSKEWEAALRRNEKAVAKGEA